MISLFDKNGIVYAASDCEDFEAWAQELSLARAAWLEALVIKHLPAWVHRKGKSTKAADAATAYMREVGFELCEDKDALDYVVKLKGDIIGRFKVCLQSPQPGLCRLCGQPMTLASPLDHHQLCAVTETLKSKITARKRIVVPDVSLN